MPAQPMPPDPQAGAASPQPDQISQPDQMAQYLNQNAYIPVWLRPDIAAGVIRHFGKDGSAIVHPHPTMHGDVDAAMATGGVSPPAVGGQQAAAPMMPMSAGAPPAAAAGPVVPQGAPLAGLRPQVGAAGQAGRSIFGGGPIGVSGPSQQMPVFAQRGMALDGRAGVKVPGTTPPPEAEHDTVHAMLDPGEAVFNTKQLAGIKVKPGKGHLVRADQKKAMQGAAKNARRK